MLAGCGRGRKAGQLRPGAVNVELAGQREEDARVAPVADGRTRFEVVPLADNFVAGVRYRFPGQFGLA